MTRDALFYDGRKKYSTARAGPAIQSGELLLTAPRADWRLCNDHGTSVFDQLRIFMSPRPLYSQPDLASTARIGRIQSGRSGKFRGRRAVVRFRKMRFSLRIRASNIALLAINSPRHRAVSFIYPQWRSCRGFPSEFPGNSRVPPRAF